jgi:hypothetical protein
MAEPLDSPSIEPVPLPTPWPDANRRLLLGHGAPIDPLVRLATFDYAQFERFIWEWVNGYIAHRYLEVQHRGGAGDKGRDVIGWLDESSVSPRRWDLFQCKRYKDPLTPSDFLLELGKLCYYTFRGDYTPPSRYFIVSPKGVGNTLQDLIDDPKSLKEKLIEKWNDWCLHAITKTEAVVLGGAFLDYVGTFDFSIVKTLPPAELIEQHSKTKYHLAVFGTSFKPRPPVSQPPADIAEGELGYVSRAYEAFADHLKTPVVGPSDFSSHSHLAHCFSHARECFYSAESLKEFSRDNLPDDSAFVNLCHQMLQGVKPTLNKLHVDGYEKLVDVTEKAVGVAITSNILVSEIEPSDRVGLCHQLANNGTIHWVVK